MRVYELCAILVVVTATISSAQAPPRVVELGPQAAITTADRQEISRLLEASPKPAWLWTLRRNMVGEWLVQVFATPDVERANLRRGSATLFRAQLSLGDRNAHNLSGPKSWIIGRTFPYAQVVMPNRTFQDIRGPNDPNQPFGNSTTLTDDELVSLVTFLRTSPANPSINYGVAPGRRANFSMDGVRGNLPIDTVSEKDGAVSAAIRLAPGGSSVQIVRLRRAGTTWTIIEMTGFVA